MEIALNFQLANVQAATFVATKRSRMKADASGDTVNRSMCAAPTRDETCVELAACPTMGGRSFR